MSVSGIGGVFFQCRDRAAMRSWYNENLGFTSDEDGNTSFQWREEAEGGLPGAHARTTWAPFLDSADSFQPSHTNPLLDSKPIYRYPCDTDIS
jgi:hypothetical protein